MKKIKIISMLVISFASVMLVMGIAACSKNGNRSSTLYVRLTDNPIVLDEVNIDIREVNVNLNDGKGWVTLNTNIGMYNLLDLQNGVDTLIASAILPVGTLQEIRFVLGTVNNVVVNGITYPLTIPSGSESGLKIKVNKMLSADIETLVIDFDAALSIKEEPSGYKLRPVLKVK